MKQEIKLILLDLDGTLLNSRKEISAATEAALARAAEKGILIVPCTGRFYGGMPEAVRKKPPRLCKIPAILPLRTLR